VDLSEFPPEKPLSEKKEDGKEEGDDEAPVVQELPPEE
jgi:hypothetical protein